VNAQARDPHPGPPPRREREKNPHPGPLPPRERGIAIALFLLLLLCYTYTLPRWADPNQNSRLDMVVAVVDDGTFQIDKYVENTVDYAKVGEHYYSDKAPGAAFLGIPVYAGLRVFLNLPIMERLMDRLTHIEALQATLREGGTGLLEHKVRFAIAQTALTFVASALPTAVMGALMFRLLARFTTRPWPRVGVVLGYGLLTPAFAYAGAFYGHQLSATCLFAAFYIVFRYASAAGADHRAEAEGKGSHPPLVEGKLREKAALPPTRSLLLVGLLLGYSVITEYPSALVAGILFLYTVYAVADLRPRHRLSGAPSGQAGKPAPPQIGTPARLPRSHKLLALGKVVLPGVLVAVGWMIYNTSVFGSPLELGYSHSELWTEQHHTGFMSLTLPHWQALWGITLSPFRGLFVLSPLLLLAIPGFLLWYRSREHRPEFWVALSSTLAMFLFNSSSVMWWGGFTVGPRYLLPMLPLMALPIVFVLREWEDRAWMRALSGLLFAWSLVATWGLTLAGQAFPPDTIRNPLIEYAWPNWRAGNIARNVGMFLGLPGLASLLPLLVGIMALFWLIYRQASVLTARSEAAMANE